MIKLTKMDWPRLKDISVEYASFSTKYKILDKGNGSPQVLALQKKLRLHVSVN